MRALLGVVVLAGALCAPGVADAAIWYRDRDGDGVGSAASGTRSSDTRPAGYAAEGGDCLDDDPSVYPGADEACDGADNDCDGKVDRDDPDDLQPWYPDDDGDGAGRSLDAPYRDCDPPAARGYASNRLDCDDADPDVAPGAPERCNEVDDDCDGAVDEDPVEGVRVFVDDDRDGYGAPGTGTLRCVVPDGFVTNDADCDDSSVRYAPFAPESCDPPLVDTNCDGSVGDADGDEDGVPACDDCDDGDADVYPGAPDTPYDGVRTDCDRVDDFDADGDGYRSDAHGGDDCDDTDADVNPGAVEVDGNGIDDDCDGRSAGGDAPVDEVEPGGDLPAGAVPTDCACAAGGRPSAAWALLGAVALWRRRRGGR